MDALRFDQNLSFKGFDKSFSWKKIPKGTFRRIDNCRFLSESKYIDIGLGNFYSNIGTKFPQTLCGVTKESFELTDGVLKKGQKIFVNENSFNARTDGNGSLIVPINVGKKYKELKLNLEEEELAKIAKEKFSKIASDPGLIEKSLPALLEMMHISKTHFPSHVCDMII